MPCYRPHNWSYLLSNDKKLKISLRKSLRIKRASFSSKARAEAAAAAAKLLLENPVFKESKHIACYMAHGSEMDVMEIINAIWASKKRCYLPAIMFTEGKMLRFLAYKEQETLLPNRYKILEPDWTHGKEIPPEKLDLVLIPSIGFDLAGFRLGTGGGYYDRTFAFMQQKPRPKKPVLLGVAFQQQQESLLPHDPWDVVLDGVLTEEKIIFFKKDS